MIDGKTHQEILDLFSAYQKRQGQVSLERFMMFAGIGTASKGKNKQVYRRKVDALIKNNLHRWGLVARDSVKWNFCTDVYYEPPRPAPDFRPCVRPMKVWRDSSLATWTPEIEAEINGRKERQRQQLEAARQAEMQQERASTKNLRVKRHADKTT